MDAQQAAYALQQGGFNNPPPPPPSITPAQAQAALQMMPQQPPQQAAAPASSSWNSADTKEAILGAPANIADAVANTTRNALNTGVNLVNGATSIAGIPAIPNIPQGQSVRDMLGLPQANTADKIAQGIASFVPYSTGLSELGAVGDASNLANRMGAAASEGALYGGTQNPDNPEQGALIGSVAAGATPALTAIPGAIARPAANLYAKTALPGLISKGTDLIQSGLGNASDYAMALKNNFINAGTTADSLLDNRWNTAKNIDNQYQQGLTAWGMQPSQQQNLAESLQNSKPILYAGGLNNNAINSYTDDLLNGKINPDEDVLGKFDNTNYVNTLKNIKSDLQEKIGNETDTTYDNSLSHVNKWLENPPLNWQDAVRRSINTNDAPRTWSVKNNNASDDYLQGVAGQAGASLKQSVYDSAKNAPGAGIKNLWDSANQAYGQKMGYLQVPGESGNALQFNKTMANAMQGKDNPDAALFNQFMPSTSQTGTDAFDHLSDLYGSRDANGNIIPDAKTAQNSLLSYALRDANDKGDASKAVLNYYQGMSPAQRDVMLANNPAQPYFQTVNRGIDQMKYGMPKTAPQGFLPKLGYHALAASPIGLLGFGGGLLAGMPWEQALMLGAGAAAGGKLGAKGIQKFATPQGVQRAMAYAKSPIGSSGLISNYLLPSQMAQQQGAQ